MVRNKPDRPARTRAPRPARLGTALYLLVAFLAWLLPVARPDAGWAMGAITILAFPWSLLAMAFGTGPMESGITMLFMAMGIIANAWILYVVLKRRYGKPAATAGEGT